MRCPRKNGGLRSRPHRKGHGCGSLQTPGAGEAVRAEGSELWGAGRYGNACVVRNQALEKAPALQGLAKGAQWNQETKPLSSALSLQLRLLIKLVAGWRRKKLRGPDSLLQNRRQKLNLKVRENKSTTGHFCSFFLTG